jgi:signal transduction histidine kinase
LFKQRRDIFYGFGLVLLLALGISFFFSRLIIKPLSLMTARLASGDASNLRLAEIPAPLEIATLGAALDDKAAALLHKSRYIEEFAANVSHELKTPLTSIRGAVELLQESGETMSEEQRQRFLANIDAAASRTDRLVNRLLQLARVEAGHETTEEVITVQSFLDALPDGYGDLVSIDNRCPTELTFPAAALEGIVGNLLDNALRYRQRAPAKLTLEVEGKALHLRVEDDGPGISADNQKRLFERFFTTERDRGGTGLGLPIVLATAESHGGRVSVSSSSTGTIVDVWVAL